MKKKIIERLFYPIVRCFMITFMPNLLSPLHLACYSKCHKEREGMIKDFQKVSKKMRRITTKYSENSDSKDEMDSSVKLFYDVYNHIDDLSLDELKVLRNYCCTVGKAHFMGVIQRVDSPIEIDKISGLEDTIDHQIKMKKRRSRRV